MHLGLGGGAFGTPAATLVASDRPKSIAAADFDRDGDPDLAVGSSFGFAGSTLLAQVEIFWNDGTGQFPTKTRPVFNSVSPLDLAVADFNGDGTPDLASAESSSGVVRVLIANDTGGFSGAAYNVGGKLTEFLNDILAAGAYGGVDGAACAWSRQTANRLRRPGRD